MTLKKLLPFIIVVILPVLFALALPYLIRLQMFTDPQQLVSILAMIILPFTEGFLLISTSPLRSVSKVSYRVFIPWLPILIFFLITFLFQLEDCACWIIGLPLYLLLSSVGGVTAGFFTLKKSNLPESQHVMNE